MKNKNLTISWFLLLFGATIYGTFFTANKIVAEAEVPFIAFTFWQSLIGGTILILLSIITKNFPKFSKKHLTSYFFTAILGVVIPIIILAFIGNKIPAGILTLAITLTPGMTFIFAVIMGLDKIRFVSILGLFLGLIGVCFLIFSQGSISTKGTGIWIIFSLIVPILFAANNVFVAIVKPPEATPIMRATGLVISAALLTFPIMLINDGFYIFWNKSDGASFIILWTGIINAVTFYCMFEIIHRAGPIFFGQYNYVIVIAGVIWSIIFFDEKLTHWFWIAFIVMLFSLYLGNVGAKKNISVNK